MPSTVPVKIVCLHHRGEIHFDAAKDASLSTPLPEYVKLPLPNAEAFTQVVKTFGMKMMLDWPPIEGEKIEYYIFRDAGGKNVTYDLYKKIVGTLDKAIGLPKVNKTGTCRISPIYGEQLYVQPQPEYVDTISYAIFLAFKDGKLKETAPDVVIGEMYILADGYRNCRVRLLKTISSSLEPSSSEELGESRVSLERERTISTRCGPVGEYENGCVRVHSVSGNLHGVYVEKVKVFCIDYGGEPITVYRDHLYSVESVCPKLKTLEDLAIPVNVKYINFSDVDNDARLEHLRKRKQIINIETVSEAIGNTPALVNIFH